MSTGLYRLLSRRLQRTGQSFREPRATGGRRPASVLAALAVVTVLGAAVGTAFVMLIGDSESADGSVARATAAPAVGSAAGGEDTSQDRPVDLARGDARPEPAGSIEPPAPIDPPAVSGLRIVSQSWRRGGLGSKALVTFTVRNSNPFAVRDVEIACVFSRRDGSHLTDRTRMIPGEVNRGARKTFAAVHVGFVNVNASKAKCTLVAASKI